MKKKFLLITFLLLSSSDFAQIEFKGTMGINFLSVPSMQDYVNQLNIIPTEDQLGGFNAAVIFAGEIGVFLNENYLASTEIGYQIFSVSSISEFGKYELAHYNLMTSFIIYNIISGNGYNFKFGGGGGIRFNSVDETLPAHVDSKNYTSAGYGFVVRLEGNTLLGGNVYANIGAEIRYDVNGEPENNGTPLYNNSTREKVNFNTLSFGVRLGITYIIGVTN